MKTSVKKLKDHLSHYLHRVEKGEELIVTSHNRAVAKIIPIDQAIPANQNKISFFKDLEKLHKSILSEGKHKTPSSKVVISERKKQRY